MIDQRSIDTVFAALTIWREARGGSFDGKAGVASVIKNRADNPKWWGRNIQEVCEQPWQFSSMTDPKDVNLIKWPKLVDITWQDSIEAADAVIAGTIPDSTDGAVYYHDISISLPTKWGAVVKTIQIGRLIFYREA